MKIHIFCLLREAQTAITISCAGAWAGGLMRSVHYFRDYLRIFSHVSYTGWKFSHVLNYNWQAYATLVRNTRNIQWVTRNSRVFLGKVKFPQPAKNLMHLTKSDCLLTCSQQLATCTSHSESRPLLIPSLSSISVHSHLRLAPPNGLLPSHFPTETPYGFLIFSVSIARHTNLTPLTLKSPN